MVARNRKADVPNALFSGEMVLMIMVITGEIQHSATRYSKPSIVSEK